MNTSIPSLLITSISKAAANATISPGTLQPWVNDINRRVAEEGKFPKPAVAYIPFSPPLSSGIISAGSAVSGRDQTPAK